MSDRLILEEPTSSRHASTHAGRKEGTIGVWLEEIKASGARGWVKFPDPRNPTYVTKIKQGSYSRTKPGDFDVVSRKVDGDGERAPGEKIWLYVRVHNDDNDWNDKP